MSYLYDEKDIAATLKKAIAQGASDEEVERLLTARNQKIEAGGEAMAQYANDALTKQAESYIASRRDVQKPDLEKFQAAREEAAADNLRVAEQMHKRNYHDGVTQNKLDTDYKEKQVRAEYRRSALADEEKLAAGGLGRGNGAPTSGYGESARTAAYLNYQNALGEVREQESRQNADLYARYQDGMDESMLAYGNQKNEIAKDFAEQSLKQHNEDRDYMLKRNEQNAEMNRWNQEFDAKQEESLLSRARDEEQKAYESALEAFKQTGEITNETQAVLLGLPVGTKTMARTEFENESAHMWSVYARDDAWHAQEMEYKNKALNKSSSSGRSSSSSSNQNFKNNYDLFKAVGVIANKEMSEALGLPIGTKYWQYLESTKESERKQQETDYKTGTY